MSTMQGALPAPRRPGTNEKERPMTPPHKLHHPPLPKPKKTPEQPQEKKATKSPATVIAEKSMNTLTKECAGSVSDLYIESTLLVELIKKRQEEVNNQLGSRVKEYFEDRAVKRQEKLSQTSYFKALEREKKRSERRMNGPSSTAGGNKTTPAKTVAFEFFGSSVREAALADSAEPSNNPDTPDNNNSTGVSQPQFLLQTPFNNVANRVRISTSEANMRPPSDQSRPLPPDSDPMEPPSRAVHSSLPRDMEQLPENLSQLPEKSKHESNLSSKSNRSSKSPVRRPKKKPVNTRLMEDCHDEDAIRQAMDNEMAIHKETEARAGKHAKQREAYAALGTMSETIRAITARVKKEFRRLDENGDMLLSFEEFMDQHPDENRLTFNDIDHDHDGFLSFSEYLSWCMRDELSSMFKSLTVFSKLDQDMNGIVDANEMSILLQGHPAHDIIVSTARKHFDVVFDKFLQIVVTWENKDMTVLEIINSCAKDAVKDVLQVSNDIPVSQFWNIMRLCFPDMSPNNEVVRLIDADKDGFLSFQEFWDAIVELSSRKI